MSRKLRVEYPGAIYHVMNGGDRREPIFKDDVDRQRFLQTLVLAKTKEAKNRQAQKANITILLTDSFTEKELNMGQKVLASRAFFTSRFQRVGAT